MVLATATGAAPVLAVAHAAKAVAKAGSWAGFVPLALRDPRGLDTLHDLTVAPASLPASWVSVPLLGWLMLGLTVLGGARAWRRVDGLPSGSVVVARTGLAGAMVLFGAVLAVWAGRCL